MLILTIVLSLVGCTNAGSYSDANVATNKIVGYIQGSSMPNIIYVNLQQLTHLIYSSINVASATDPTLVNYFSMNHISRCVNDAHAAGKKVLVSLADTDKGDLGKICASPVLRARLVSNISNLIKTYNLDGIDIDYEYYKDPDLQLNVSNLVKDLYPVLHPENKLITVAIAVHDRAVNPDAIQFVDFFNVMTFCIRYPESSTYSDSAYFMNQFVANGFPREKLLMGMPFWATDAEGNGPSYRDIVDQLNPTPEQNSARIFTLLDEGVLQIIAGGELWWNGIDLAIQKVDFVKRNRFGGLMIWEVGQDKFKDPRSLLQTIYDRLILSSPGPASTTSLSG